MPKYRIVQTERGSRHFYGDPKPIEFKTGWEAANTAFRVGGEVAVLKDEWRMTRFEASTGRFIPEEPVSR